MTRRWMSAALAIAAVVAATVGVSAPADASAADVVRWQRRLNALHCDAGPADGKAGTWTRSASIRFQSRHALAQTGSFNAATRTRLFATNAQRCDVRRVPARSGSGRRIVISQKQNWVWVIGAGNQVLRQGGIVDNPGELRKGSYRTGSYCGRAARVTRNSSGSVWLDHFVRFAPCGFGFHRIPRAMSTGRQIHADNLLGTNLAQSHGCIRLSAGMATRIWNFTSAGRTVVRVL
jgi:Putative peptidoglycan binding domain/L,D-transpeptidase catalytic domain